MENSGGELLRGKLYNNRGNRISCSSLKLRRLLPRSGAGLGPVWVWAAKSWLEAGDCEGVVMPEAISGESKDSQIVTKLNNTSDLWMCIAKVHIRGSTPWYGLPVQTSGKTPGEACWLNNYIFDIIFIPLRDLPNDVWSHRWWLQPLNYNWSQG